ncbi:bZIP transcription factor JlbA/IDI-4 [Aspergillus ibericus CBS 121593]|uniref:BZIP domain-containing protein n=1 Tax=Aspergillus ibericus CBS 121593 TaxID=1448316 RepID=A0A395GQA6_9EURO|nr:hypothetical protein BO80DRAFT_504595 [Aspergillus ibericus CBS 121593]RAK97554.1 hypothetical protein BO80DRAFT_504595 [Aspergillus ibericus CBS 121593]
MSINGIGMNMASSIKPSKLKLRRSPRHSTPAKPQAAKTPSIGALINPVSPRPTLPSPSSHPPSPRRKRPLLPFHRSGSSGSKDPATSIQEWLSLQLPSCTPPARPPRSSSVNETQPSAFDYQQHHHLSYSSDPFYLPPELHPSQLTFSDFDLASSAAFPPVDPSFYESSDPSFPGSALSCLSDSSYQDQILGYPLPPLLPVPAADPDPIDSLLSSPELSESLNLLGSPSVQSQESSEPSPQMPAVSNTASPLNRSRDPPKEPPNRVKKRELNTMAARRYRQRRVDRMNQLEEELEAIKRERDELKMRVSKLEGETEALRNVDEMPVTIMPDS